MAVAAAVGVVCAAGALLRVGLSTGYAEGAAQGYGERKAERDLLADILAEARRRALTFPQVVVAHPAHAGKPVYWDVTVTSSSSSYAEGRPAWPIVWTNFDLVEEKVGLYNHQRVLGRVAAVKDNAVYLEFLGKP